MKAINLIAFSMMFTLLFTACKKGDSGEGSDCEEDNLTKVTYTNTGTTPLRVSVATQLTPQFETVSPVFTIDLAPGASVEKVFFADKYFTVWQSNCATNCTLATHNYKTYEACNEYEAKLGF